MEPQPAFSGFGKSFRSGFGVELDGSGVGLVDFEQGCLQQVGSGRVRFFFFKKSEKCKQ